MRCGLTACAPAAEQVSTISSVAAMRNLSQRQMAVDRCTVDCVEHDRCATIATLSLRVGRCVAAKFLRPDRHVGGALAAPESTGFDGRAGKSSIASRARLSARSSRMSDGNDRDLAGLRLHRYVRSRSPAHSGNTTADPPGIRLPAVSTCRDGMKIDMPRSTSAMSTDAAPPLPLTKSWPAPP